MENVNNDLKKYIIISILVLLGVLITIDLAYIYYEANFNQYALPSFCSISDFVDCDGVARTTESQFLGVPLAYWGLFLYSFIVMLLGVDKLKKVPFLKFLEVFKNKFHYIASLGLISFAISMILLCVSLFEIHKICVMCMITYLLNLAIGLTAVKGIEGGFIGAIKQSAKDFLDALKPLPYKIAFVVVMICAVGFLGWTFTSAKFSPALKFSREYGEFTKEGPNPYAVQGNILGSDAKDAVVLQVFSDYKCPMCKACNVMIHKVVTEFKNVRVEHHAMPLDTKCNKYLQQEFHQGSCIMAQYAEAAQMQGKFWEVNSLFFELRPSTEDEIIEVLENSGFDLDIDKLRKDAHSDAVNKIIQKDIDFAVSHKQIGTPALKMGKDFEMGVKGYHDLKKWVEAHGGKPKNKLF
ncbi:thioredoxin domain-containing protein [bacterium]|nr:thioredoxin domain-containing protein [bacterium]